MVLHGHCKGGGDEVANDLQVVAMMLQMCCKWGWLKGVLQVGCNEFANGLQAGCNEIAIGVKGDCKVYAMMLSWVAIVLQ